MREFFDTKIVIPDGRKSGKYLQKTLEKRQTFAQVNLSDLCKSLPFCIMELDSKEEVGEALENCHSCQSDNLDMYHHIYCSFGSGTKVLALIDDQKEISARCVVNPKMGTYAPAYGNNHYLLVARLQYAGYEAGEVIPVEVAKRKLEESLVIEPDSIIPPKSRTIKTVLKDQTKTITYLEKRNDRLTKELDPTYERWLLAPEGPIRDDFLDRFFEVAYAQKITREKLKKARRIQKRVDAGKTTILHHIPISEDYRYVKEDKIEEIKTDLFLDSARAFICAKKVTKKGWYKK